MAATCDVCGKGPGFGMSVSHSHRRTRRRWNPNIQTVHALTGPSGKTPKKLGVCTSCLNAGKVVLTGNKRADKVYYWHTGYPGGIKERTAAKILEGKHPERVLHKAVERMLSRGPLGRRQMKNLRIYSGAEHPHEAQNPTKVDIAALNSKNVRSA